VKLLSGKDGSGSISFEMKQILKHILITFIHFNPVKHKLVDDVTDWPWSSYHRYQKEGFYGNMRSSDIFESYHNVDMGE
jgi:hypothetical protein